MSGVDTALGILELVAWALAILALAALITFLVIMAGKQLDARREAGAASTGDGPAEP